VARRHSAEQPVTLPVVVSAPVFYYDLNSPYAYLAAARVDDVLPVAPEWRPIAFGVIVRETGKVPWSFGEESRAEGIADIARRAEERGLPPVTYPEGWPREIYSINRLRAALVAEEHGRLKEFSMACFTLMFAEERPVVGEEDFLDAAQRSGVDPDAITDGIARQEIKDRLRDDTAAAIERGVRGVPTVAVGDELFWGDDRLEAAAAALAQRA
jgi:2-hydroxychromene-2-carboxylate isomerase